MSDWGFTVEKETADGKEGWNVFLPHQCESWDIAASHHDWTQSLDATLSNWVLVDHKTAVEEFESFLVEGQQALEALKAGKEFKQAPVA